MFFISWGSRASGFCCMWLLHYVFKYLVYLKSGPTVATYGAAIIEMRLCHSLINAIHSALWNISFRVLKAYITYRKLEFRKCEAFHSKPSTGLLSCSGLLKSRNKPRLEEDQDNFILIN